MGKPLNDITGFTFGSLTVLQLGESKGNGAVWLCQCKCGTQKQIRSSDLVFSGVKSCGCEQSLRKSVALKKHGMVKTRTYRIWTNMKTRCRTHLDYAGRGIKVSDEWQKFDNFLADMGVAPDNMSLDRIDVNGNYEKSNCRWVTHKEQMNNTRVNIFIDWNGKTQTLSQWSEEIGMQYQTLRARLNAGWSVEDAMTKPLQQILADEAQLQDADGNTMTPEQAKTYVATLP